MKIRSLALVVGIALLSSPLMAGADMVDVLTVKLNDGCGVEQLIQLGDDFNAYRKEHGSVQYEILTPLYSANQGVFIIVGRFPSQEAFGKAQDAFRAEQMQAGSAASKLIKRAIECAPLVSRESALTVK